MRRAFSVSLPGDRTLTLGAQTLVMGVLNVTPDSFSDGGRDAGADAAIARGLAMAADGADLLDVGGESTRPGAAPVSADEELDRVLPVVTALAREGLLVSIDTTKAAVAAACVEAGAVMVNDISGGQYDPGVLDVAARSGAALVLMHMRGHHSDMYAGATYEDVVAEVASDLEARVGEAVAAGVARDAILLDPGIGFAKRAAHSWQVLSQLDATSLRTLALPLLVGASRKSFLQAAIGDRPAAQRDAATAATVAVSVMLGAHVVRVHDVATMVQVARVADMIAATRAHAVP